MPSERPRPIRGKFSRAAGSKHLAELSVGWFGISHRLAEDAVRRRMRAHWYRIQTTDGRSVYRLLRFNPHLKGACDDEPKEIWIDWDGWLELCAYSSEAEEEKIELVISRAGVFAAIRACWDYPNAPERMAFRISILSFVLGIVSLGLGILAI